MLTWANEPELQFSLGIAAKELRSGGVAVFPTDTVYGIAQLVEANIAGPSRLFDIKRRDHGKKIPVMIGGVEDLERFGRDIPDYAKKLAKEFWPGGMTLVVRASDEIPIAYRSDNGTVALRVPGESVALRLVREVQGPLAVTSANTSGKPAPTSHRHLEECIAQEADVVLCGGETGGCSASTIVDCTDLVPEIIREGAVSRDAIYKAIQ